MGKPNAAPDADAPWPLGKYQVLGTIAHGALTEVLRARLEGIAGFQRHFAIRRLRGEVARNPKAVAIVEEEARRAAVLAHGHIVQILDLGHDANGTLYLVTEWVDGWSLEEVVDQLVSKRARMPVAHVAWIGQRLAQALAYAHARPVPDQPEASFVHDGVEPGNVLVSRGGEVKLADFGLAHAARRISADDTALLSRAHLPTPPERLAGHATAAGDVWSLATTLHALLVGAPAAGALPGIASVRDDVPDALIDLLGRARAEAPGDRPFLSDLEKSLHDIELSGDVFTQETLADWLRGLFDEERRETDEAIPRDEASGLGISDDPEGDLDLGDDLIDAPELQRERTAPRPGGSEHHTAIGASGAARVAQRHGRTEPSVSKSSAAGGADDLALDDEPDAAMEIPPASGPGWAVAVALLIVGLLLGGAAGFALVPTPAPVPPPGSSLRVTVAGDAPAAVEVDGEALTAERPLPPGEHEVVVTFEGGAAWTGRVSVDEGSRHLLVVEPRPMAADDAPPPVDEE